MTVSLCPATALPVDGAIVIVFPPGFRLVDAADEHQLARVGGDASRIAEMRVSNVAPHLSGTFCAAPLPGGNVYGPDGQSAACLLLRRDKPPQSGARDARGLQRELPRYEADHANIFVRTGAKAELF